MDLRSTLHISTWRVRNAHVPEGSQNWYLWCAHLTNALARMAASSVCIAHSPAFVLSLVPVTCAQQLAKCAHLNPRHAIPLLSFVVRALQFVKCAHLNLGRILQLLRCAHINFRHALPFLSFVVHALQSVKCAHLNLGRVWQLVKCAHLNLRHAILLVSFVVHALQCVKCAHLNFWCTIHW